MYYQKGQIQKIDHVKREEQKNDENSFEFIHDRPLTHAQFWEILIFQS